MSTFRLSFADELEDNHEQQVCSMRALFQLSLVLVLTIHRCSLQTVTHRFQLHAFFHSAGFSSSSEATQTPQGFPQLAWSRLLVHSNWNLSHARAELRRSACGLSLDVASCWLVDARLFAVDPRCVSCCSLDSMRALGTHEWGTPVSADSQPSQPGVHSNRSLLERVRQLLHGRPIFVAELCPLLFGWGFHGATELPPSCKATLGFQRWISGNLFALRSSQTRLSTYTRLSSGLSSFPSNLGSTWVPIVFVSWGPWPKRNHQIPPQCHHSHDQTTICMVFDHFHGSPNRIQIQPTGLANSCNRTLLRFKLPSRFRSVANFSVRSCHWHLDWLSSQLLYLGHAVSTVSILCIAFSARMTSSIALIIASPSVRMTTRCHISRLWAANSNGCSFFEKDCACHRSTSSVLQDQNWQLIGTFILCQKAINALAAPRSVWPSFQPSFTNFVSCLAPMVTRQFWFCSACSKINWTHCQFFPDCIGLPQSHSSIEVTIHEFSELCHVTCMVLSMKRRLWFLDLSMMQLKSVDEQHLRLRTSLALSGHGHAWTELHDIHRTWLECQFPHGSVHNLLMAGDGLHLGANASDELNMVHQHHCQSFFCTHARIRDRHLLDWSFRLQCVLGLTFLGTYTLDTSCVVWPAFLQMSSRSACVTCCWCFARFCLFDPSLCPFPPKPYVLLSDSFSHYLCFCLCCSCRYLCLSVFGFCLLSGPSRCCGCVFNVSIFVSQRCSFVDSRSTRQHMVTNSITKMCHVQSCLWSSRKPWPRDLGPYSPTSFCEAANLFLVSASMISIYTHVRFVCLVGRGTTYEFPSVTSVFLCAKMQRSQLIGSQDGV